MVKGKRLYVLDALRGLAVIAMILYHTLWDLVYMFDVNIPWFGSTTAHVFQLSIRWAFILISGFSWHLGSKKLKRALVVLGASAVISAVTFFFTYEARILFGVLGLLGASMLVAIPLNKLFAKIPPVVGVVLMSLLFTLTYNIPRGYIGVGKTVFFHLPDFFYCHTVTAFFGFPPKGFFSADFVPFFPWVFMFFIGYFLYLFFKKYNLLIGLSAFRVKPLEFVGRHSLVIYMVHQPLVYAILLLIFRFVSGKI
ncbi:MAG: DUF1624 domain-containing protein [Clostridia bacterium]|nr:DUF1624 domain-containing protein [Clostridia bacterium]